MPVKRGEKCQYLQICVFCAYRDAQAVVMEKEIDEKRYTYVGEVMLSGDSTFDRLTNK